MKVISIKQPWADCVIRGHKTIELRTWTTSYYDRFGGNNDLAIHASKGNSKREVYRIIDRNFPGLKVFDWDMTFGAIIGVAKLANIYQFGNEYTYDSHKNEHLCPLKDFEFVRYGWVLRDVRPLDEPIFCNGQLKLWETELL